LYCFRCSASLRFRVVCCSEPAILNHLFAPCKLPCFTAFVACAACFAALGPYCLLLAALFCFHQHRSEIMKEFFTSVKLVKHSSLPTNPSHFASLRDSLRRCYLGRSRCVLRLFRRANEYSTDKFRLASWLNGTGIHLAIRHSVISTPIYRASRKAFCTVPSNDKG